MAIDIKYGKITAEHGDVVHGKPGVPLNDSGDEPVFVIRAQDVAAFGAVNCYAEIADLHGASEELVEAAKKVALHIQAWQAAHPERVKVPD